MNTLFLSTNPRPDGLPTWDLAVGLSGNIAVATGPYALAQDVASACRVFLGEIWYNTAAGIPFFQQVLGRRPSYQFMKAQFVAAALTVPGVASAVCFLTGPGRNRVVGGQIQITDVDGVTAVVASPQLGVAPFYVSGVSV